MIAYSYPGSTEFLVGNVSEVSTMRPSNEMAFDFVMAPFDQSLSDTYWFKLSSLSSSRVFPSPSSFLAAEVESTSRDEYDAAFKAIKKAIQADQLNKAVLSRRLKTPKADQDLYHLFVNLKNQYPDAFTYLISTPETGTWMGASPELVLSHKANKTVTTAIAGTQALTTSIDEVEWGEKEIQEHAFIEDYLKEALVANDIDFNISTKSTIPAGDICHIHSRIEIKSHTNLSQLIEIIHPGPALSGYPVKPAIKLIREIESNSRQFYCGYLGPISSKGIDWFANIRCLQVHAQSFTLYIGGGITADSNLDSEWEETNLKANTLLSILETANSI